jgi:hypothetical protein
MNKLLKLISPRYAPGAAAQAKAIAGSIKAAGSASVQIAVTFVSPPEVESLQALF